MADQIFVIGHVNPDTDSIASAMGYAWLLRARDGADTVAARAGAINPQTAWVLRKLGLDAPVLLTDASPRFDSVMRRLDTIRPEAQLGLAWNLASRTGGIAPVVTEDGKPQQVRVFEYQRLEEESLPAPELAPGARWGVCCRPGRRCHYAVGFRTALAEFRCPFQPARFDDGDVADSGCEPTPDAARLPDYQVEEVVLGDLLQVSVLGAQDFLAAVGKGDEEVTPLNHLYDLADSPTRHGLVANQVASGKHGIPLGSAVNGVEKC